MAVLRSLLPGGARHGRWVLVSLPLLFTVGWMFDGLFKTALIPAFAPLFAGTVMVTLAATCMAVYITRLHSGQATLTRRLQEADELHRVTIRVTESETLQGAVGLVLDALRQQYPFTSAALVPAGDGQARSAWRVARNCAANSLPEAFDQAALMDHRISGPARCENVFPDSGVSDFRAFLPGCRASTTVAVTLPNNIHTSTLVLGFDSEPNLSAGDLDWLTTFAKGLALPLERVRIQEELAKLAYSDPMTGLPNYRSFRRNLHDECERAARYGHPVSLLILDVDRFKRVNDEYGHPVGDEVLRHVAKVVQEHVRSIDSPARYGGEEFVVVCPETEVVAALVLAERLREAVENSPCTLPNGETIGVTMSIGVSVFPDEAILEANLIEIADAALYQAKRSGRNRVNCGINSVVAHDIVLPHEHAGVGLEVARV